MIKKYHKIGFEGSTINHSPKKAKRTGWVGDKLKLRKTRKDNLFYPKHMIDPLTPAPQHLLNIIITRASSIWCQKNSLVTCPVFIRPSYSYTTRQPSFSMNFLRKNFHNSHHLYSCALVLAKKWAEVNVNFSAICG